MRIELPECVIRSWRKSDLDSVVRYANNRKIWRNLTDRFPHPYTREDGKWWIDHATSRDPESNFAIDVDGEAVGGVGFELGSDVHKRTAEIGYWLGEPYWGKGIATAALESLTEYAFFTHDLVRINACVFAWNPPSMRVLEKAGYVKEGVRRACVFKDGEIIDDHVFVKLRLP